MNIASKIAVSGKLSAGLDWAHEINFDVRDFNDLFRNLVPDSPKLLCASGRLYGRVHGNGLMSKLKLEELQCDRLQTEGILSIDVSEEKLLVHPETLSVEGLEGPVRKIKVAGGTIQLDAEQLQVKHLGIEAGGIHGNITGHWNWETREGTLAGSWSGQTAKPHVRHGGTWDGSVSWPRVGPRQVNISMTTRGSAPWGPWQGEVNILGSGNTWSTSQWQMSAPRLASRWKDADIILEDVRAEIAADWPDVRLVSLSAANAERLKAEGAFSAEDSSWAFSLQAEGLRSNRQQSSQIDLELAAHGGRQDISVETFRMTQHGLKIEAAGMIALPSTELRDVHARASWVVRPADTKRNFGNVSGNLQCEGAIKGTAWPTDLQLQSVLSGKEVTLGKNVITDIRIPWQVWIDTKRLTCQTDPFELFGGTWDMKAEHDLSGQTTHLALDANEVLLQFMVELLGLPLMCQGSVATHLEIDLPWYDMKEVTVSGRWDVNDIFMPPIEADSAEGRIRIQHGTAAFEQIRLKRHQGLASASARFRLEEPQYVTVEIMAQQWPTSLPNRSVTFVTDGQGQAVLDLSKRAGQGTGNLSSSVAIDDEESGHVSAQITVEGRTIDLEDVRIEALGGLADGTAKVPLDRGLGCTIELQWRDMEMSRLAEWWPGLKGLSGRSSGSLTAEPTDAPRPMEPLHLEIHADVSDGSFRGAGISGCQISAYLGEERLLIDHSEFRLMDGTLSASGSLRRRNGKDSAHVRADFSQLELDQFIHLFLPGARTMQGRLSGTGFLVVLSGLRGMTGQADVQLGESDLGHTVVVSTLYDAMNLKFARSQFTGQGQISMRFEGSSLKIPSFIYFNRGAEIRGAGSIDDLTRGKTSPVKGYAIGSVRPLKGIRLPGIGDLDRLMASLQTSVSSVRIQGTLAEPKAESVPLREIGEALRMLLWRQLGE
jgi:hypothetical protein